MKEEIIIKFLNGNCTSEELKMVREWQKNPSSKKEFDEILEKRWNHVPVTIPIKVEKLPQKIQNILNVDPSVNNDTSLNEVQNITKNSPKAKIKNFDFFYFMRVAAVFLIFLFSFIITFNLVSNEAVEKPVVATIKTLKKEALIGQKLKIQLPDGSKVVLNSGSFLEFPEKFNAENRIVKLVGEAFFEVKSDPSRPFKVHTRSATTTVLGTTFNINEREEGTKIVLKEGKVKVELPEQSEYQKNVLLAPGEMAVVNSIEGNLEVEQVDVNEYTAWQRGVIVFKNKPLGEIFSQLEMWYDVDFEVSEKAKSNAKVSGEFQNENLENILSGLSFSFDFHFEISGKEVKIYK